MIAVNLDRVTFRYATEPLFEALSWEIHTDRCVGLVGPNGAGKSTLLRLIAGEIVSETGFTSRKKDLTIGYLAQEPQLGDSETVLDEVLASHQKLAEIEAKLAQVEASLADPRVYGDEQALAHALGRQERLLAGYEELGGPGFENRARGILRGLRFSDKDQQLPVDILSGGQKKLLGLAKLFVTRPGLLLLDEPDNHLDLAGKAELEQFIRGYPGAVVIISHDRYLLDMVADEIVELEDGRLTRYPGNYSEYVVEKELRLQSQQRMFQAQQKEITRLEQAAKRLLMWGHVFDNVKFIRRGQHIEKRLERIERIERPVLERKRMGLELKGWRGSKKVLELNGVSLSFAPEATGGDLTTLGADGGPQGAQILQELDLLVWWGQRVGLVGPNGAGKSVLFQIVLGELTATSGRVVVGPSVQIGHYAQEHETLDYGSTLIDTVRYAARLTEDAAVSFLGRFLFNYDQARGTVGNLSGGERSRLQMALLMLSSANFLLLDEPTNNLDIASAEVLEDALEEFEGTVVVISHDRYFLDRVVDRVVELDEGRLAEYDGGYSDYAACKQPA
ncbi:MAG: ribosomal protection-like ABC-F family protein [Anaerolineales bacterium]